MVLNLRQQDALSYLYPKAHRAPEGGEIKLYVICMLRMTHSKYHTSRGTVP